MSGDKEDDVTDDFEEAVESEEQPDTERLSAAANLEVRRRLEDKLEERRLNKLIQDYDFDF